MAPLAGPVVAAAVVLPDGWIVAELDDSKRVDPETRVALDREIRGVALAVGVGVVSERVIDRINIYRPGSWRCGSRLAAVRAVRPRSSRRPSSAHVPGAPSRRDRRRRARAIDRGRVDHRQGRPRSASRRLPPPLASVRLRHEQGYMTPQHVSALRQHGLSPIHRLSFPRLGGESGRHGTALPGPLRSVDRGGFRGLAGIRRVRLRRRPRFLSHASEESCSSACSIRAARRWRSSARPCSFGPGLTMKLPIYLDYHATTPCDPRVVEAMLPCFREKFAIRPAAVIRSAARRRRWSSARGRWPGPRAHAGRGRLHVLRDRGQQPRDQGRGLRPARGRGRHPHRERADRAQVRARAPGHARGGRVQGHLARGRRARADGSRRSRRGGIGRDDPRQPDARQQRDWYDRAAGRAGRDRARSRRVGAPTPSRRSARSRSAWTTWM